MMDTSLRRKGVLFAWKNTSPESFYGSWHASESQGAARWPPGQLAVPQFVPAIEWLLHLIVPTTLLQTRVPQDMCWPLADGQENMPSVQNGHCGGVWGEGECQTLMEWDMQSLGVGNWVFSAHLSVVSLDSFSLSMKGNTCCSTNCPVISTPGVMSLCGVFMRWHLEW